MSRLFKAALILAGIIVLLAGILAAYVLYPGKAQSLDQRLALLEPAFETTTPTGAGPHPVVLLFHGCGGLVGEHGEKDIMGNYARTVVESGYAAIIVDSFGPRGIGFEDAVRRVCSGLHLRGRARAGDVLAAVQYVKLSPEFDANRIILAGWSHGGWTVMDTMTMDFVHHWPAALHRPDPNLLDGLAGVYLTYPFCGFPALSHDRSWAHHVPTSVVVAEKDDIVGLGRCAETLINMDAEGVVLEVEVFEDVTHAFDESDQTATSSFTYDEAASSRAHQRFAGFLKDLETDAPFPNPDRVMVDVGSVED